MVRLNRKILYYDFDADLDINFSQNFIHYRGTLDDGLNRYDISPHNVSF